MDTEERELAWATASLTTADFQWLKDHGTLAGPAPGVGCVTVAHPKAASPGASSQDKPDSHGNKKRKRCARKHAWPEPGTILQASYFGTRYEAEVIQEPRYKSGRALKVLSGPAAGKVYHSLSGAMLAATENQRKEQGLGRRGVSNGWTFWMKGQTNAKRA